MHALNLMRSAGFPVHGILHVGANVGQERLDYAESGANPCIYVEPIDAVFESLQRNIEGFPGHIAVQAVCSDVEGEIVAFNIASNNGESSSFLNLGAHAKLYPNIEYTTCQAIRTTTVDNLLDALQLQHMPNLLIIDTQGTEIKVLKGASKTLSIIDGIFVEVSETPLYEGGCTFEEINSLLKSVGFHLRWMSMDANGVGDAFYCISRKQTDDLPTYEGNHAPGGDASQSSLSAWSQPNDAAGVINQRYTGSFGFHTSEERNPWWQIDLGEGISLREVRIYNRIDVARWRARTLRLYLSNDGSTWELVHDQGGYAFGGIDGRPLRVFLNGLVARFVRIQLNECTFLHLDEVEIY